MKFSTLFTFFIFLSGLSSSLAQDASDYVALSSFMSQADLSSIEQENPLRYQQLAYLNRHAYHLSESGEKSVDGYPSLSDVIKLYPSEPDLNLSLIESGNMNMMAYKIIFYMDKYSHYRIDGSTQLLVIPPVNILLQKANIDIE